MVRAEYQRMDSLIRGLPAPAGFAKLPPRLAQALLTPDEEDQRRIFDVTTQNGHIRRDRTERLSPLHPTSTPPTIPTSRRRSVAALIGTVMAAVIVAAFAFAFLAHSRV